MATKAQLQDRYDKAVEQCGETADKYSDAVDKIEELKKTLADTESYCQQFESRIHELNDEKNEVYKKLRSAGRAEAELDKVTKYCNRMQKYIVELAMDGVIKGEEY